MLPHPNKPTPLHSAQNLPAPPLTSLRHGWQISAIGSQPPHARLPQSLRPLCPHALRQLALRPRGSFPVLFVWIRQFRVPPAKHPAASALPSISYASNKCITQLMRHKTKVRYVRRKTKNSAISRSREAFSPNAVNSAIALFANSVAISCERPSPYTAG